MAGNHTPSMVNGGLYLMTEDTAHNSRDLTALQAELHYLIVSDITAEEKKCKAEELLKKCNAKKESLGKCEKDDPLPGVYIPLIQTFIDNPSNLSGKLEELLEKNPGQLFLELQKAVLQLKVYDQKETLPQLKAHALQKAAEKLTEIIKSTSKENEPFIHWTALRNRGILLEEMGKNYEARLQYEEILEKNAEEASTYAQLALYYFKEREDAKALFHIDKAFEVGFQNPQIEQQYIYIHNSINPGAISDKARNNLKEVLKIKQDLVQAFKEVPSLNVSIKNTQEELDKFINDKSHFNSEESCFFKQSIFLTLRKWNSYTPILPISDGEKHIGGGYFCRHKGQGTVIDPGFNFIENFANAGGRILDIDNIIITHAHNDHTADFESILTLLYKYNDNKKDKKEPLKRINLYMNTGSLLKFSKLLDFRRCSYINKVYTLDHDQTYTLYKEHPDSLENSIQLTTLPAYHDELITKDYAAGIKLEFIYNKNGKDKRTILITSDTGLFPQTKINDKDLPNLAAEEIWDKYKTEHEKINLLIAHIGSVKEQEITTAYSPTLETSLENGFYRNHLGIIGTCRLISRLGPRLALVSEWGEELKNIRQDIIGIIADVVAANSNEPKPKVLPASTAFVYNIKTEEIYCIVHKQMENFKDIQYQEIIEKSCEYYNNNGKEFYFFCKELNESDKYNMIEDINTFKRNLKKHELKNTKKEQ